MLMSSGSLMQRQYQSLSAEITKKNTCEHNTESSIFYIVCQNDGLRNDIICKAMSFLQSFIRLHHRKLRRRDIKRHRHLARYIKVSCSKVQNSAVFCNALPRRMCRSNNRSISRWKINQKKRHNNSFTLFVLDSNMLSASLGRAKWW